MAGGRDGHQLGGDLLGRASAAVQQARRRLLPAGPFRHGHRGFDRVLDHPVDEARFTLLGQQTEPVKSPQGRRAAARVQPRQRGDQCGGVLLAEGRHRRGDVAHRLRLGAQAARQPIPQVRGAQRAGRLRVDGARPAARRCQARQHAGQQQRDARGALLAGPGELLVGRLAELTMDQLPGGAGRQRSGAQHLVGRARHLVHQRVTRHPVAVPQRADQYGPQPAQPLGEVGEPAQRGAVGPLQIVDQEQQRPLRADRDQQRVQAEQHGLGSGVGLLAGRQDVVGDHRPGGCGLAQPAFAGRGGGRGEQALEELAHHAEGEVPLHRCRMGAQHVDVLAGGAGRQFAQQRRPADPERAGHQQCGPAGGAAVDRLAHQGQLTVPFEQHPLGVLPSHAGTSGVPGGH